MAIASSAPLENITQIMRELGLSSYCKVIISEQDAEHGKPDPQCFLLAAQKLGVKPVDSIVIEDATSGIEAAARAGMSSIAVTNTHPEDRLKGADIVTASLKNISLNDIENLIDRRREMEKTLVLIKPDAVARGLNGAIISRLEEGGLKLVALKMFQMDKALAEKHYAPHKDKPFFKSLVGYITSGPITAAVFSGENSVEKGRLMIGATDPKNSKKGTIRGDFGLDIEHNTIHGSDAPETAEREIALFFKSAELVDYQRE
jgi:nucleoside-diphosphate kinase